MIEWDSDILCTIKKSYPEKVMMYRYKHPGETYNNYFQYISFPTGLVGREQWERERERERETNHKLLWIR